MFINNLNEPKPFLNQYPGFKEALAYLQQLTEFPPLGEVELDGRRVYASVQEYDTVPLETIPWEFHRQYIDIQYIYAGRESIGLAHTEALSDAEYRDAEDIALSTKTVPSVRVDMNAGEFMILFPEDAHRPRGSYAEKAEHVQKIVIKVHV